MNGKLIFLTFPFTRRVHCHCTVLHGCPPVQSGWGFIFVKYFLEISTKQGTPCCPFSVWVAGPVDWLSSNMKINKRNPYHNFLLNIPEAEVNKGFNIQTLTINSTSSLLTPRPDISCLWSQDQQSPASDILTGLQSWLGFGGSILAGDNMRRAVSRQAVRWGLSSTVIRVNIA